MYKYLINFFQVIKWTVLRLRYRGLKSQISRKILTDLNLHGIAFSSLDEIFPGGKFLETMQAWVEANKKT